MFAFNGVLDERIDAIFARASKRNISETELLQALNDAQLAVCVDVLNGILVGDGRRRINGRQRHKIKIRMLKMLDFVYKSMGYSMKKNRLSSKNVDSLFTKSAAKFCPIKDDIKREYLKRIASNGEV